jgi:hypothetical protein
MHEMYENTDDRSYRENKKNCLIFSAISATFIISNSVDDYTRVILAETAGFGLLLGYTYAMYKAGRDCCEQEKDKYSELRALSPLSSAKNTYGTI